jgi:hypothetical protein
MCQAPERGRRMTPPKLLEICLFVILFSLIPVLYLNLSLSVLDDVSNKRWRGADFIAYYTGARLLADGKSPYDATARVLEARSLGVREDRPYIYLPPLAIVIIPLALLPPQPATLIWFWMNVALLILSATLMIGMLELHRNRIYPVAFLIGTLVFYPAICSICAGQANVLLLTLLVLAWYLARRGNEVLTGVMIAFASSIKIFPFCIALYFLWKGKYRIFLGTVAALIVLLGISVVAVGLDPHLTYVKSVVPTQFVKLHPLNQSLWAFIARILPIDQPNALLLWRLLSLSASALLVLMTAFFIPRGARNPEALDLEISLVVVGMLLVSTASWTGTLTLMMIAYAAATRQLIDGSCAQVRLLSMATLLSYLAASSQRLIEIYTVLPGGKRPAPVWLLSMPMYGMIILWLTIAYMLLGQRKAPIVPAIPC